MARKATFAVVVPAYNEEQVIESSLSSLGDVISLEHVYVVSDGSTDHTSKLARKTASNVLVLKKNIGKAKALYRLITKYDLTNRYRYIMFFDADTKLSSNYFKEIRKHIANKPACIVGTVKSDRKKIISAYRIFEYGFSHRFFKNAQNIMGTIIIAPGCTSVYRSETLKQLDFSGGTLTEDFDLTLQIHKKRIGRIVYCSGANVYTQDPLTIADYWKQIMRWNTGFWQNFFLHKLYIPKDKASAETMLIIGDFIFWMATLIFALSQPLFFLKLYLSATLVTLLISCITIVVEKQYWALVYAPLFGFFQLLNISSLVLSFFRATINRNKKLSWQKLTRYAS